MATYIRPRKDGGCSECSSPDELVGRGRCIHILGENENHMELKRIERGIYEVQVGESLMTIEAQKETVKKFFNEIPKIEEEKKQRILDFLNNED